MSYSDRDWLNSARLKCKFCSTLFYLTTPVASSKKNGRIYKICYTNDKKHTFSSIKILRKVQGFIPDLTCFDMNFFLCWLSEKCQDDNQYLFMHCKGSSGL